VSVCASQAVYSKKQLGYAFANIDKDA